MPYTHRKIGDKECVYKKDGGAKVGCTKGDVNKYLAALHANANESLDLTKLKKPKIFTYTAYRLPNKEDLHEINSANLTAQEIFNGLSYTIIGRGILSDESKSDIIESINMLINTNPTNKEYKKALNMAEELKPRFRKVHPSELQETKPITEMKGGKAENMSVKDIADKFELPISKIEKQISIGKKIEKEHTDNPELAKEIAMDHLSEFPDYYTRLVKLEKEADKHLKKKNMDEGIKDLIKRLIRENLFVISKK